MISIPLQDADSQQLSINLGGQATQVNIYQKATGLFCDVLVNGLQIVGGVICENLNRIVRDAYLGFVGDLVFFDTQGGSDPSSPGLGTRFLLFYLTAAEVTGGA